MALVQAHGQQQALEATGVGLRQGLTHTTVLPILRGSHPWRQKLGSLLARPVEWSKLFVRDRANPLQHCLPESKISLNCGASSTGSTMDRGHLRAAHGASASSICAAMANVARDHVAASYRGRRYLAMVVVGHLHSVIRVQELL